MDPSELFDTDDWAAATEQAVEALFQEAFVAAAQSAAAQFGITFDVHNERAVAWLGSTTRKFAKDITETTLAAITGELQEAYRLGESIPQIRDRIRSVFQEASKTRATTIARTEIINASNAGLLETYRQADVAQKRWLTARDERVDSICWEHQVAGPIGLEESFPSGHTAPGAHPRCRCVIQPVVGAKSRQLVGSKTTADILYAPVPRMAEVRCQVCHHLLAKNVSDGEFVCSKCSRRNQRLYVIERGVLIEERRL